MPGESPRRGAAAAAQTLAVALAVTAVVVAAGYGLQRLVLRSPPDGELVAARIEGALLQYRFVESVVQVDGEPVRRAQCLEGWEPGHNGRPAGRGARVLFSDGERLILGDRRVVRLVASRSPTHVPPIAELELAGCGRSLTNHIYGRLVGSRRTTAVPATLAGRPALRLHVKTRRTTFDLFVDPDTLAPLGLHVVADGVSGWSRVRQVRLTPALKARFLERFDG